MGMASRHPELRFGLYIVLECVDYWDILCGMYTPDVIHNTNSWISISSQKKKYYDTKYELYFHSVQKLFKSGGVCKNILDYIRGVRSSYKRQK
jgi:hypothetical protein